MKAVWTLARRALYGRNPTRRPREGPAEQSPEDEMLEAAFPRPGGGIDWAAVAKAADARADDARRAGRRTEGKRE